MDLAAQGLKWAASNVFTSSAIHSWQESVLRGQIQPWLDSNFQAWEWDDESDVTRGRMIFRGLVLRADTLNSALLSAGFQLDGNATIRRLALTLPLKWAADLGIFSEPWMLDVSGVRVQVRGCTAAEKELSVQRNAEAMQGGGGCGEGSGRAAEDRDEQASNKAPAGLFLEMFPLLQAMENLRLGVRDAELVVVHPHEPGSLLRVGLEDCNVQTTSGPPDWRETYLAVSQDAQIFKLARLRGLRVLAEKQEGGEAGPALLEGASAVLQLSKSPVPGANGPADFVAGSYEAKLVLEGAGRPQGRFEAEVSADVAPGAGVSMAWGGSPIRVQLEHAVPPEEAALAAGWAAALAGAFAECQPEAALQLEAAQRRAAAEASQRLREKARAARLQARCEALEQQLRMESAHRAAEEQWRAECQRAAPRLRELLQATVPRSSTLEQESAAALDELLLKLVPGFSTGADAMDAPPADAQARRNGPAVTSLMRGLHRSLNQGAMAASEAAVAGAEAEAVVFRPPFESDEQAPAASSGSGGRPQQAAGFSEGARRALRVVKRVASDAAQLARTSGNADFFSRSDLWIGLKVCGSSQLHSFSTGPLHVPEAFGPVGDLADGGEVELVALWLDLGSTYEPGEAIHREDFTFALGALEVSVEEQQEDGTLLDTVAFSHSFVSGAGRAKVFDSRTAAVVDQLRNKECSRRVTTVAIHSFSHAGKTKWWEHTWDTMEHIYPDKWIGNRFSPAGNWVGSGNGAGIGVVRDFGGGVPADHALRSRLVSGSRPVSACSDVSSWADADADRTPEEDEDGDVFLDALEEMSASMMSAASCAAAAARPSQAPADACALTFTKKSWSKASQRKRIAGNSDHFSKAPLHIALRLRGRKEWHKFDTGTLAQQVAVIKADRGGGWEDEGAEIDMAVMWLDLSSLYQTGDPLAREDFTIALDRITVELASTSTGSDSRCPLLDHSFCAGVKAQVWDSRNAVIIDATAAQPWLFTVNMHTSSKAGKTKWREGVWEGQPYVYPDKWISNCLDLAGNWVGPGKGCHGGAFRHHGKSVIVENILDRLSGDADELQHLRGVRPIRPR